MMPWMLDLCSGLGGASQAFEDDPAWTVVRVENNPLLSGVPSTRMLDVLQWMDWLPELIDELGIPDLGWASPPCLDFSTAFAAPRARAYRADPLAVWEPDMSIVEACIDIFQYIIERSEGEGFFWIIENVHGACQYFMPELGKHRQKLGPFYLWGVFPTIVMPDGWTHSKADGDTWSTDPLRPNRRALVPLEVSTALLDAICTQSTLADWV